MLDVSEYIHSIPYLVLIFVLGLRTLNLSFVIQIKKVNYIMTIVSIPSRKRYSRISSGSIL